MTSVQAEFSSTRLSAELDTDSHMPDANQHGASSPSPLTNILAQLGGRFAADVVDILQKLPENANQKNNTPQLIQSQTINKETYEHQQFALARLRSKNIDGAVDYIQRHAPELQDWLNGQIKGYAPRYHHKKFQKNNLSTSIHALQQDISVVPDGILVDPEAGRIARILGQFGIFRAWAYGHSTDDGDGWLERKELETVWQNIGIAKSKRHARRIIQQGIQQGYWTQDKATKRIYLFGQVKVTARLIQETLDAGYHHLIKTNKPGKRRVQVNLSDSLQEASAHLYAAWLVAKDPECKGTTISRDMLCDLWQISIPTLLEWEEIAGIGKQANFAQSNDTSR